jgi:hypothetical protein
MRWPALLAQKEIENQDCRGVEKGEQTLIPWDGLDNPKEHLGEGRIGGRSHCAGGQNVLNRGGKR